jgi:hypothetical protein
MLMLQPVNRLKSVVLILLATSLAAQCMPPKRPIRYIRRSQPQNTESWCQLGTAVLTLPTGLAAHAHPDSNGIALVDHASKLANELLAAYYQNSSYNAGWACVDGVQTIRSLGALFSANQKSDQEDDADIMLDGEESNDEPEIVIDNPQWQRFVRTAGYVLASAEAVTRMLAATYGTNSNAYTDNLSSWCEIVHGLTSQIRLANACLQAPNKQRKAITLVLSIANAIALILQYINLPDQPKAPRIWQSARVAAQPHAELDPIMGQRPSGTKEDDPHEYWRTCVQFFTQDAATAGKYYSNQEAFIGPFNTWCRDQHIEPFTPYVPRDRLWQGFAIEQTRLSASKTQEQLRTTPLPVLRPLSEINPSAIKARNNECPSCLENINNKAPLSIHPSCRYAFHDRCITQWIAQCRKAGKARRLLQPQAPDNITCPNPNCQAQITEADLAAYRPAAS